MSKAFEYFASEEKMATAVEDPDDGIKHIFTLSKEELAKLLELWSSRTALWRESIAYFVGLLELKQSLPILEKALFDVNTNVHIEAALSISDAVLEGGEEYPFSDKIKNRICELADSPVGEGFEEIQELADLLR